MPLFLIPLIASFKSAVGAAITFCSKPPGSWIAAAIAACLGLWWFGQHEYNSGKLACEKAHAEAAANEKVREKIVFADADQRSTQRTTQSETINTQDKVIVRVIHDQAAAMPDHDATCVPPDIADRLRMLN